jgi:sigma-B regulation protein RsbU (phosphoserine phosphatase)
MELSKELDAKLLDLNALLETSKLLNSKLDLAFILNHLLLTSMGKLLVPKACVILEQNGSFEVAASKGLKDKGKFSDLAAFSKANGLELLVPIRSAKQHLGYIALGQKLGRSAGYTKTEAEFLELLAGISATSIENTLMVSELKTVNRTLDSKVQQLNTLFDLTKEFNAGFDEEKILKVLGFTVSAQMLVRRYAMFLLNKSTGVFERRFLNDLTALEIPADVMATFANMSSPVFLDADNFPSLCDLRFKLAVPLREQNRTSGVLLLGERLTKTPFSQSDIDFIFSASSQAISSIENARLIKETLEKKALEKELEVAREIQMGLLPKDNPKIQGFDVAGQNLPSKQVGGDYYDIIQLDETHHLFAIADVTGKGTPASLLMANMQASLRAFCSMFSAATTPVATWLPDIVGKINDIIYANTPPDKFITFFCGVLNVKTKTFQYVDAGHNPPYVVHPDGSLQLLDKGGLILGIMPLFAPYETDVITLASGDVLYLFTDGVTEAMNAQREEFGEPRLEALLKRLNRNTALDILLETLAAVKAFEPEGEQHDDITAIVLKVN